MLTNQKVKNSDKMITYLKNNASLALPAGWRALECNGPVKQQGKLRVLYIVAANGVDARAPLCIAPYYK